MKQIMRVLESLRECPGHAAEIAEETGLSRKAVSAYLSDLAACGAIRVVARGVRPDKGDGKCKRGPGFVVWEAA